MKLSDREIDRLLGGREHLSVTEREALLERVLARTGSPARPRFAVMRWVGVAFAVLVATVYVGTRPREPEFAARGVALHPAFTVSCLTDGRAAPCQLGAKLVFEVAAHGYRAFAAVAEAPDGSTLWLFPSQTDGQSVQLDGSTTLPEAVLLDGPRGDYVIHGLFSQRPLSRDELRAAIQQPAPDQELVLQRLRVP